MMRRSIFFFLLILLILLPCALARAASLRVDFYDVGKADAMLVTMPDGYRVLIDAATNKEGGTLAERFKREGLQDIDLMIITHFDKDHVGGADKMIEDVGVGQVIMPDYPKDSKQYSQFVEALEESPQTQVVRMGTKERIDMGLGEVQMTITAAHRKDYGKDEENDFSLAVRMTYGDTRFFFTGDAEDPRQRELLAEGDVACDVLKVPYHGRLVSASENFLTAANPKIAFITDSEEEPANPLVIDLLERLGAQVYCAKDGDIAVVSDGKTVAVE